MSSPVSSFRPEGGPISEERSRKRLARKAALEGTSFLRQSTTTAFQVTKDKSFKDSAQKILDAVQNGSLDCPEILRSKDRLEEALGKIQFSADEGEMRNGLREQGFFLLHFKREGISWFLRVCQKEILFIASAEANISPRVSFELDPLHGSTQVTERAERAFRIGAPFDMELLISFLLEAKGDPEISSAMMHRSVAIAVKKDWERAKGGLDLKKGKSKETEHQAFLNLLFFLCPNVPKVAFRLIKYFQLRDTLIHLGKAMKRGEPGSLKLLRQLDLDEFDRTALKLLQKGHLKEEEYRQAKATVVEARGLARSAVDVPLVVSGTLATADSVLLASRPTVPTMAFGRLVYEGREQEEAESGRFSRVRYKERGPEPSDPLDAGMSRRFVACPYLCDRWPGLLDSVKSLLRTQIPEIREQIRQLEGPIPLFLLLFDAKLALALREGGEEGAFDTTPLKRALEYVPRDWFDASLLARIDPIVEGLGAAWGEKKEPSGPLEKLYLLREEFFLFQQHRGYDTPALDYKKQEERLTEMIVSLPSSDDPIWTQSDRKPLFTILRYLLLATEHWPKAVSRHPSLGYAYRLLYFQCLAIAVAISKNLLRGFQHTPLEALGFFRDGLKWTLLDERLREKERELQQFFVPGYSADFELKGEFVFGPDERLVDVSAPSDLFLDSFLNSADPKEQEALVSVGIDRVNQSRKDQRKAVKKELFNKNSPLIDPDLSEFVFLLSSLKSDLAYGQDPNLYLMEQGRFHPAAVSKGNIEKAFPWRRDFWHLREYDLARGFLEDKNADEITRSRDGTAVVQWIEKSPERKELIELLRVFVDGRDRIERLIGYFREHPEQLRLFSWKELFFVFLFHPTRLTDRLEENPDTKRALFAFLEETIQDFFSAKNFLSAIEMIELGLLLKWVYPALQEGSPSFTPYIEKAKELSADSQSLVFVIVMGAMIEGEKEGDQDLLGALLKISETWGVPSSNWIEKRFSPHIAAFLEKKKGALEALSKEKKEELLRRFSRKIEDWARALIDSKELEKLGLPQSRFVWESAAFGDIRLQENLFLQKIDDQRTADDFRSGRLSYSVHRTHEGRNFSFLPLSQIGKSGLRPHHQRQIMEEAKKTPAALFFCSPTRREVLIDRGEEGIQLLLLSSSLLVGEEKFGATIFQNIFSASYGRLYLDKGELGEAPYLRGAEGAELHYDAAKNLLEVTRLDKDRNRNIETFPVSDLLQESGSSSTSSFFEDPIGLSFQVKDRHLASIEHPGFFLLQDQLPLGKPHRVLQNQEGETRVVFESGVSELKEGKLVPLDAPSRLSLVLSLGLQAGQEDRALDELSKLVLIAPLSPEERETLFALTTTISHLPLQLKAVAYFAENIFKFPPAAEEEKQKALELITPAFAAIVPLYVQALQKRIPLNRLDELALLNFALELSGRLFLNEAVKQFPLPEALKQTIQEMAVGLLKALPHIGTFSFSRQGLPPTSVAGLHPIHLRKQMLCQKTALLETFEREEIANAWPTPGLSSQALARLLQPLQTDGLLDQGCRLLAQKKYLLFGKEANFAIVYALAREGTTEERKELRRLFDLAAATNHLQLEGTAELKAVMDSPHRYPTVEEIKKRLERLAEAKETEYYLALRWFSFFTPSALSKLSSLVAKSIGFLGKLLKERTRAFFRARNYNIQPLAKEETPTALLLDSSQLERIDRGWSDMFAEWVASHGEIKEASELAHSSEPAIQEYLQSADRRSIEPKGDLRALKTSMEEALEDLKEEEALLLEDLEFVFRPLSKEEWIRQSKIPPIDQATLPLLFFRGTLQAYQELTLLPKAKAEEHFQKIGELLVKKSRQGQLKRALHLLNRYVAISEPEEKKIVFNQFIRTLEQTRSYPLTRSNRIRLLFEAGQEVLLRAPQTERIQEIVQTFQASGKMLFEMPTGAGKTHAIIPVSSAEAAAESDHLHVNLFPDALVTDNTGSMKQKWETSFALSVDSFRFSRTSLVTSEGLSYLLERLKEAITKKMPFNLPPETLGALELHLLSLFADGQDRSLSGEELHCIEQLKEILNLLRTRGKGLIDEARALLDPISRLIYTQGTAKPVSKREATLIQDLFFLLLQNESFNKALIANRHTDLSQETYKQTVAPAIARAIAPKLEITAEQEADYLAYLLGGKEPPWLRLHAYSEQIDLVRGSLLLIFPEALKGGVNLKYGLSKKHIQKKRFAIPYVSANLPKETDANPSEFQNHHETLVKTLFVYYQQGLSHEQLTALRERLQQEAAEFLGKGVPAAYNFPQILYNKIFGDLPINIARLERSEEAIRAYLDLFVVEQIVLFPKTLVSTNSNLLSQLASSVSMTATPQASLAHSPTTRFLPMEGSAGYMRHHFFAKGKGIDSIDPATLIEDATALLLKDHHKALIDAGGLFRGRTNREIAAYLREQLPQDEVEEIVYFDEQKGIFVSYTTGEAIESSRVDPSKRFVFYDQARATGSDLKLGAMASALLLLDTATPLSLALQGLGRMRQIADGQSISLGLTAPLHHLLFHGKEPLSLREKQQIVYDHMQEVEKKGEETFNLASFKQQIDNEIRSAVMEKLLQGTVSQAKEIFFQARSILLSQTPLSPSALYRDLDINMPTATLIELHLKRACDAINQCGCFSFFEKRALKKAIRALEANWKASRTTPLPPFTIGSSSPIGTDCEVLRQVEQQIEQQVEVMKQHRRFPLRGVTNWSPKIDYVNTHFSNAISVARFSLFPTFRTIQLFKFNRPFLYHGVLLTARLALLVVAIQMSRLVILRYLPQIRNWPIRTLLYGLWTGVQIGLAVRKTKRGDLPEIYRAKDLVATHVDRKIGNALHPRLYFTNNYLPLTPHDLFIPEQVPFTQEQKPCFQVLYTHDLQSGELSAHLFDQHDAGQMRRILLHRSKEGPDRRRLYLYDLQNGAVISKSAPVSDEELTHHKDFTRLTTQAKWVDGYAYYTPQELAEVKRLSDLVGKSRFIKASENGPLLYQSRKRKAFFQAAVASQL